MAEITCYPITDDDDGDVWKQDASYPPGGSASVTTLSGGQPAKAYAGGQYLVRIGLIRFDTSAIPVGSVVTVATFRAMMENLTYDADGRSLNIEWYNTSNWPIDATDYTDSVGTTAASKDISELPATFEWVEISLSAPSTVNVGGYTGLRLGISGASPTGLNRGYYTQYQSGVNMPRLVVTYTTGYSNKVLGCAATVIGKVLGVASSAIAKVIGV